VRSDRFSALTGRAFDIILSNPPYCRSGDLDTLQPEVRLHEPRTALDGGADGLDFYRRFLPECADHLKAGGRIYLEGGDGQAAAVTELGVSAGLKLESIHNDLAGKQRVVVLSAASGR
jgi:release factor glutamine methyltransferase